MVFRSLSAVVVLVTAACCAAPLAWAQDATIHQVFQAAEAGKFTEAQAMMDKVLRDHPNSGKAHYIEAELLAKQGKFAQARTELATAERLAPGLPFAKPEAVQHLRALAARAQAATPAPARAAQAAPDLNMGFAREVPAAPGGTPWGMILFVAAMAGLAFVYFRNKAAKQASQANQASQASQQPYGQAPGPIARAAYPQYANAGSVPFGASAAAPAMGPMGAPGPMGAAGPMSGGFGGAGLGAGIVGGLATGAALGAGMVAGSALMHHFTDGNRSASETPRPPAPSSDPLSTPDPLFNNAAPLNNDMGGTDFGIADAGSWDDSGSGGGGGDDEWN